MEEYRVNRRMTNGAWIQRVEARGVRRGLEKPFLSHPASKYIGEHNPKETEKRMV